jgi:hypothetical protein
MSTTGAQAMFSALVARAQLQELRRVLRMIFHLPFEEQTVVMNHEIARISERLSADELATMYRMISYEMRVDQLMRRQGQEEFQVPVPVVQKPPIKKTKVIKIVDLAMVNPHACAICMDNHCQGDEIETNCGHRFGATCFASWESTQLKTINTHVHVNCPCCRTTVTHITGYRRRRAPQTKIVK